MNFEDRGTAGGGGGSGPQYPLSDAQEIVVLKGNIIELRKELRKLQDDIELIKFALGVRR